MPYNIYKYTVISIFPSKCPSEKKKVKKFRKDVKAYVKRMLSVTQLFKPTRRAGFATLESFHHPFDVKRPKDLLEASKRMVRKWI